MDKYVVVDIETTGANPIKNDIIEIGAVKVVNGKAVDKFSELIRPNELISDYIIGITNITNEMVADKPPLEEIMPRFVEFCEDVPLVGHNIVLFDFRMLKAKATKLGFRFEKLGVDTLTISRKMLSELPSRKLGELCKYYNISLEHAHRAYDDAYATYMLFEHLKKDFYDVEPGIFVPKPMQWSVTKSSAITSKQLAFLKRLYKAHGLEEDVDFTKLTKSEASKLIDKTILAYGRI